MSTDLESYTLTFVLITLNILNSIDIDIKGTGVLTLLPYHEYMFPTHVMRTTNTQIKNAYAQSDKSLPCSDLQYVNLEESPR